MYTINLFYFRHQICYFTLVMLDPKGKDRQYTEKICRLKSHRLCIILVDRLESRLNIMSLLIEEYDR